MLAIHSNASVTRQRPAGKREDMNGGSRRPASGLWYLIFVIPFAALLYPFYLSASPSLGGMPFFYWYQFAWLFITAGFTWFVYVMVHRSR
jgi:hypothetical protein